MPEETLEFADAKLRSNYEHSLATAATEAAIEAKAEIVKHSLLAEATEEDGGADADPGGEGDPNAERDVKASLPRNAGPRSANRRLHAESSSEEHPPYDNGDEIEHPDEDPLDRWYRGDEDGEAA